MNDDGENVVLRSGAQAAGSARDLAAACGLGIAVVGILLLGAWLRADSAPASGPRRESQALAQRHRESALLDDGTYVPERPPPTSTKPAASPTPVAPVSQPGDGLDSLARRAGQDASRLRRSGKAFTAQLALNCDPRNVALLVERARGSPSLYLLPVEHRDISCFRACWGAYASREEASIAEDLPSPLRAAAGSPTPKRIAEVAP